VTSVSTDAFYDETRLYGDAPWMFSVLVPHVRASFLKAGQAIEAYEKRIGKFERDKLILAGKPADSSKPKHGFYEIFELAMKFLSNPWKLWVSGQLHLRKTVLRLGFVDRIAYHRESGFSSAKKSLPFNTLGGEDMLKMEMHRWPEYV